MTRLVVSMLALSPCLVFSAGLHAATLRTATTLDRPQVRVADLFDEPGAAGPQILGPGPSPGGRFVVEATQAAAIARQFGVAWHPTTHAERVVIERPGRLMSREEMVSALRTALTAVGAPSDSDLEIPGLAAPLVALDATPATAVEQLDYDAQTGRFTATLAVSTASDPVLRLRLSGRLLAMLDIAVPTRRLASGDVLAVGDLQMLRVPAGRIAAGDVVRTPGQAIGQALRRVAIAGQPVPLADLGAPFIVQKGARVMMSLSASGLSLSAVGTAMSTGALGDRISVRNPASGALLEAEVTGADQVRIDPSSSPRLPGQTGLGKVAQR